MRNFLSVLLLMICSNVFGAVHADFSADKFSGCPPLLVNFTNTSLPATAAWSWNFGNGNTSALTNPSAVFNNPGVYHVKLKVTNGTEVDSVTKTVTVFRLPQVDFHSVKTTICQNDTLSFINDVIPGDGAITNYGWGFGDGTASNSINALHSYSQTGSYNITLVVQDANGCSANTSKTSYIQVLSAPIAEFTASPAASCEVSQLVTFTNQSIGTGLTYSWQLHDTVSSTAVNPSHTYVQEKKNVTLTATNPNGCKGTVVHQISAGKVIADFTSKIKGCTGEQIQFTNLSNVAGSSSWNFGDGTVSTQASPIKVYNTPGIYTVSLTQTDGNCSDYIQKISHIVITQGFNVTFNQQNMPYSCYDATAVVNFTNTTPEGVSFYWDFGDGVRTTEENPTHAYVGHANYLGYVIVTDSNGCSVKAILQRSVSTRMPEPFFRADTMSCPGGAVYFHNSSIAGAAYKWYFGDGDSSNLANPTHFYQNVGDYTVTLIAINRNGCDSSLTKTAYIKVREVVTDFSVNQTFSPCPPFVTIFSSSASRGDLTYLWDFGDGTTDTAANPTHIYFHPGIFTVKMITTTPNGCVDTVIYPNLIEVQGPTGTFSATPSSGCVPLTTTFETTISANTTKLWCDLGDGTLVSDSLTFIHTYTTVNTFNPKFILIDNVGCAVPYDLPPIVTHELPVIQLQDTFVCQGASVPVSLGSDRYQWSPADFLSCDTCGSVNIVPQTTTYYTITATNQFGCETTGNMMVSSDSLPVLNPISEVKLCLNSSVTLNAGNAYSISWSPAQYLNDSTAISPVCTPLTSLVYEVTAANSLGCKVNTQVAVNVLERIELNDLADMTVCAQTPFQLNTVLGAAPDADIEYTWTPSSFGLATDNPNPTITGLNRATTFQVIASSGTCIPDTASITVYVNALPDMEVSEGVTTTPLAEIPLYASSHQELNYVWTSNDSLSCRECRRTNVYPSQSQLVYVTGTDANGCKVTDSVKIAVMKCDPNSIFLPNIFTPNNDGLNDKFMIRSKILSNLSYFRIFDQWGGLIFETKNINEGWDGTIKGQAAPIAVYVCTLGGQCENGSDVTKSSNVTLTR